MTNSWKLQRKIFHIDIGATIIAFAEQKQLLN